jgi:hypothetical protein
MAQQLFGYSLSSTVIQQAVVWSPSPVRPKKPLPLREYSILNPAQHNYRQLNDHQHRKH